MNIVHILAASLPSLVAVIVIFIVIKNYLIDLRKQKDDLFDTESEFLKDFET